MTNVTTTPTYTRYHWAKSDRQEPSRIHLLEHHLADVGACLETLLKQPIIRKRLARSGGLDDLDAATAARLAVFAALHDIGKANVGFQTQVWQPEDLLPGQRRPYRAGHTLELAPVLGNDDDTATSEWFFPALGFWQGVLQWDNGILEWDDRDGLTACNLFVATLSHHGLPLPLEGGKQRNTALWRRYGDLNPQDCVERIGRLVRQWFPAAFTQGGTPLPAASPFQHHFLGLCILADWIGSNEQFFPFNDQPDDNYIETARERAKQAIAYIGLDLNQQRAAFAARSLPSDFPDLFPHLKAPGPNAIQQQAVLDTPLDEPIVIIESETGSGKTEAALWRFARMYQQGLVDGLYFALPTRAAARQIHQRVKDFVLRMFPEDSRPAVILAVPGYLREEDLANYPLQDYKPWWENHTGERPWAAENAKRFLSAQIAVGTVDQAMLGALQVKHAHLRAACLSRNLLVIDEVHASDYYMSAIIQGLLEAHTDAGGYALLMSATLGSVARRRWLSRSRRSDGDNLPLKDAIAAPYPAVSTSPINAAPGDPEQIVAAGRNDQQKTVAMEALPVMPDFTLVAERALTAARAGAKVLVIRNTVDYAVQTRQALGEAAAPGDTGLLFAVNGVNTLHHSRFAAPDRRLLDEAVEHRLGKDRPTGGCIIIGTQTLEQSLDIDADLLITDLCPVDVLLQRIGRLHRHRRPDRPAGYATPACIVLTPAGDDLSPLLKSGQNANGLGPHGFVYQDLRIIEATRRLVLESSESGAPWRIPEMNRELVERATHPEVLEAIAKELGDAWKVHAHIILGGKLADEGNARDKIIRRDRSFYEDNGKVIFPAGIEGEVRTRLGEDRVEVQFEPAPDSLFDRTHRIDRIDLPLRWLRGVTVPEEPVMPETTGNGFNFQIADRKFRYDRLGLRRV